MNVSTAQSWHSHLPSLSAAVLVAAASYILLKSVGPAAAALVNAGAFIVLSARARGVRAIHITDRKMTEQALRESEERLRLIVSGSGLAIWDSDLRTGKTYWNRRTFELFGYEPTPDSSITVDMWTRRVHPDDLGPLLRELERAIRDGSILNTEHRIVRETGEVVWVSAYGHYYYDEDGAPIRFAGMNLDITERKRAQEALRQADRRKDEFLAVLAHELRTPLAPLRDSLRIFEQAQITDPALRSARQIMQRQSAQMVRLIDDLLDVSRISRNKLELRREHTTLAEVAETAIETCRPTIDAAGHVLIVEIPREPVHLYADRVRVAQVFSNLLSNSSKYMRAGGEIRLAARVESGEVVVTITDTGIGVAPEDLPRIFDMFAQAGRAPDGHAVGLGIGLALVSRLVEMHGGSVTATSAGVGKGSTFTVRLPISIPEPVPAAEHEGLNGSCSESGRRRILITDDNVDAAAALSLLLTRMGNDVRIAHDGIEALSVAAGFEPDLILMDVGMPRLDGLDATRRLRDTECGKRAVIVALTGWGQEADKHRSKAAGVDYHLVKPVDPEALEQVLSGVPARRPRAAHAGQY